MQVKVDKTLWYLVQKRNIEEKIAFSHSHLSVAQSVVYKCNFVIKQHVFGCLSYKNKQKFNIFSSSTVVNWFGSRR